MYIKYRSSTIPIAYAHGIARTLQTILVEMALHNEKTVGEINLVGKEERRRMMSWHRKDLYANANCVHSLIQLTTMSKPDSEAICAWDGSLSYAELDVVSSNVARQLILAGVRVGDFIPFAFEKSLWAVVAGLAIMRAGGAFIPLDSNHPAARLEEILRRTKAKLVVTSAKVQQVFLKLGKQVVVVSAQTAYTQPDGRNDDIELPSVSPQDPAFILFTSGSTGQPKGMIHEHGPVVSHAVIHAEAMGYTKRVFQFSAFTFDMSVHDMFSTLIVGGCVCMPSEEDRLNNIAEVMNRMRVEYAFLTPSVASLLRPNDVKTLQTLACGGECYRQEIIQHLKGKIQLINSYGPAEAGTVFLRFIDREDGRTTSRTETVGYALPTVLVVLVDPENHDRLVPIGAVGELLVTGTSITRGYIDDEAKNRAAFVSNPAWAAEMGLRDRVFYKTGDLFRYNVGSFDGKCDWVKRKDGQIKFHGQRLEAGEIEHHLVGIPGIAASAIVFPKQGCFSGQLVAVVQVVSSLSIQISGEPLCIDPHQTLSVETVKKHLLKTLPSYMVPAEYVVVSKMPFTPSCKVDRRSVIAWLESWVSRLDHAIASAVSIKSSPLAREETTAHSISNVVAEMIGSRDANHGLQFQGQDFLLQSSGIDSIQVMSLSMFLKRAYSAKIPLSILLSPATTIRHLARMIDQRSQLPKDTTDTVDLLSEVKIHSSRLFRSIPTSPPPIQRPGGGPVTVRNVFLTGASGYLGSAILRDLLQRPGVKVFALARSPSTTEGLEQIRRRARSHGWWQESYSSKLQIWQGDLTKSNLGLSSENLRCLRGESEEQARIDTIIHNGAKVHYSLSYETIKLSNLYPTEELLRITAGASDISTFIYISGGRQPSTVELSESVHAVQASQTNGYGQSKFVAESLVRQCMNHVVFEHKHLRIIRPGYIIGSPQNGIANQFDFIWRLIAGCLEIEAYDEDEESNWLFISDVDLVSNVVMASLVKPNTLDDGGTDQVLDGLRFADIWNLLRDDFGYVLKPRGQAHWLQSLEATILAKGESHLLFPLLHALEKSAGKIGSSEVPNRSYTNKPDRIKEAMVANIRHLISINFLPPPPSKYEMSEGPNPSPDTSSDFAVGGSDSSATLEERSSNGNGDTDDMSSMATSHTGSYVGIDVCVIHQPHPLAFPIDFPPPP